MQSTKEIVGYVTRKHIYEIAKIKSEDQQRQMVDLEKICEDLIDRAYTIGIRVVDKIDPEEYKEFLENQREIVNEQKAELKAVKEAKLLRTL